MSNERRSLWPDASVVIALAALIVATIAVVQSGGGGGTDQPVTAAHRASPTGGRASESGVRATLSEFAIRLDKTRVTAGDVRIDVTNRGSIPHTLSIEGPGTTTPELAPGASGVLSLPGLEPGTYKLFCTVPGHRPAGMETTLTVGKAAPERAASEDKTVDYAALDRTMTDSIKQFPAPTTGVGAQPLSPTVLPDGTKQFELTVGIVDWEVSPGKKVKAWAYNGQVPGPLIRANVGDKLRVVVHNTLPMGTDVHWHGLRTSNAQDGVSPITQRLIGPGETYTYDLGAVEPTVAMYHSHHHAELQVPSGLLGPIVIGEMALPAGRTISGVSIPTGLRISQEVPLVLDDAGTIGYSLNGKSFPATAPVVARTGDWILVHYMNAGLQIHPMHLHGVKQLVIAQDGIVLDQPYFVDTVAVAPGQRFSVLVRADNPGTWVWHCHILTHVESDQGMFGMVTALVIR